MSTGVLSGLAAILPLCISGYRTDEQNPAAAEQAHANTAPRPVPSRPFDMTQLHATLETSPNTEANLHSSPLLRLPAELRNLIFSYALGEHKICIALERSKQAREKRTVSILRPCDNAKLSSEDMTSVLSITLACRQTYTETALLPFVANIFVLTLTEDGEKWLAQKLMPVQQSAIETVQCELNELFFDFMGGPLASRHCTGTFRQLEGFKTLILRGRMPGTVSGWRVRQGETEGRCLTEWEKRVVVEKVRKASGSAELEVVFL